MEAELLRVTAPATPALEQPGVAQVSLALLPGQQDVGVAPGQLVPSVDVSEGHQGDLPAGPGLDLRVGEAGVSHQGEVRVEVAGAASAHPVCLEDAVAVLDISSSHPAEAQSGPDEGRDVPQQTCHPRLLLPDLPVRLKLSNCSLVQLWLVTL